MSDSTIKFVELIETYPCLYNNTLQEYSRKDVTERAWNEVSQQMLWPVSECKEKWRNIRNNFVRSLKAPPSGSGAKAKKPYYLHDSLQFVLQYIRPVKHSAGNESSVLYSDVDLFTESEEVEVFTEENSYDPIPETSQRVESGVKARKRKKEGDGDIAEAVMEIVKSRENRKGRDEGRDDGRRMFFLSLMPDVNKLSDENFMQFRINTIVELQKILLQQERSGNSFFQTKSKSIVLPDLFYSFYFAR
ncbi:PREDICTED: uncharacterized protein LOC108380189 [Rhagoletis zephyria]|uniref:uncharacterized protein LOC108380189 n=1 Tax=Rhagoletis zephyria TaxID=28612 RepID=UPI0008114BDC|nr:PREDICTED: uncharacterized protein LOC108380189 [Rhagoletis zephyria]